MKAFLIKQKFNILFFALSIAVAVGAWYAAWAIAGNELVVPSFGKTLGEFFALFAQGSFWSSLGLTLLRTLCAVLVSFLFAAVCSLLCRLFAPFKAFFAPIIAVCRTVPTMAVTLIIMLAFPSEITPVIVTLLVIFPMFFSQIEAAADGVDSDLLQMAKVYEVPRGKVVTKIVLPQIAPNILAQFGASCSFALKLTVSAEVLAYTYRGLGGLMKTANFWVEIARLSALTLAAVVVGLLLECVFALVCRFAFPWRKGGKDVEN